MQDKNNKFDQAFIRDVEALASKFRLCLTPRSEDAIAISHPDQHDFFLTLRLDASNLIIVHFVFRTNSFKYDGERTDLHDAESMMFALFAATQGYSVALWDVSNGFSEIESEIYARFATIAQPNLSVVSQDEPGFGKLATVLGLFMAFHEFLSHYMSASSQRKTYVWNRQDLLEFRSHLAQTLVLDEDDIVVNERSRPDWRYVQAYALGFSAICSKLSKHVLDASRKELFGRSILTDENSRFQKSTISRFCYSDDDTKAIDKIISHLKEESGVYLATESHLFCATEKWILAQRGNFGLDRFQEARADFARKTRQKVDFLFDNPPLYWNARAKADRFESLCRELLSREPSVIRTRIVSPTNQPDRGRDIIAEISTVRSTDELLYIEERPVEVKKFVVQCKFSQSTLGLSKGIQPFEVLLLGDYDGYFLITNARLSSDLTASLEKLRNNSNYSAEWWSVEEVEERVRNAPDLLERYTDIVGHTEFVQTTSTTA